MENFNYLAPASLAEAYSALGNGKRSLFLAGGTDIIVMLREGRRSCDQLIDVKHIPEMMSLAWGADGSLTIGAAVSCATLYENPEVVKRLPAIVDSANIIGGIQIQSRASLGGNVCNSGPAADSSPALMALGTVCVIGSAAGTREVPIEQFFTGPGRNVLAPNELLISLKVPAQPARSGSFYHRFIPRNEMDIAVVGVGVRLQLDASGENVESARVALGAVAPTPIMVPSAAAAIVGQPANAATFAKAGAAASAAATPIDDMRGSIAQRKHLCNILTVRALNEALKRAQEAR